MACQDNFGLAALICKDGAGRCERGPARVKVHWVSRLDPARHTGASQCAREVSHGYFHPSDEFHQRHGGGVHKGAGTTRADDHTAGFLVCAIVLRDEYLWHERERDQRLAASDVGAGCCVPCCQHMYPRDLCFLEMEAGLKVGCSRSVFWMTTDKSGLGIYGKSPLDGDRGVRYSGIALTSVREHRAMVTLISPYTTLISLVQKVRLSPACRIRHCLGR
jgi:hypothetical protein